MNGKHLSKELEIIQATGEKIKYITLLFNSLKTIPLTCIELKRAEHD